MHRCRECFYFAINILVMVIASDKRQRALLPQCRIWFIVFSKLRGEKMRRVPSFVMALLLTLFVVGMSSGQKMHNCCHKDMQMANSTCGQHAAIKCTASCNGPSAGQDYCLTNMCSGALVTQDIALASTSAPLEFSGTIEKTSFSLIKQLMIPESRPTGLLSPHLPFAPLYTRHCSFLIWYPSHSSLAG